MHADLAVERRRRQDSRDARGPLYIKVPVGAGGRSHSSSPAADQHRVRCPPQSSRPASCGHHDVDSTPRVWPLSASTGGHGRRSQLQRRGAVVIRRHHNGERVLVAPCDGGHAGVKEVGFHSSRMKRRAFRSQMVNCRSDCHMRQCAAPACCDSTSRT